MLYLLPGELLALFLAAVPGGFVARRFVRAMLACLMGAVFAVLSAFITLGVLTGGRLTNAIGTIPELFSLTIVLVAIMGALGGGVGVEIWNLSLKRGFRLPSSSESP